MGKDDGVLAGAIEAGGTKFVCAVGTGPDDISRAELPTRGDPAQVLSRVTGWLRQQERVRGKINAVGMGCFGPIDLNRESPTYGSILSTPKPNWTNFDIVGTVQNAFPNVPIGFDTDVNAAALGEYYWGNARGLEDFVYITIGTGIGAGGMSGGHLLHGLSHPEMGHIMLPRVPGDTFEGVCPFHGACWEGLCSGPALLRRAGSPAEVLPADHECWSVQAQYIGYAIANIVCILSPKRVIIGGSVQKAGNLGSERFFQMIRERVRESLKGYIVVPELEEGIDGFIVPPVLGDTAGICGALSLAIRARDRL